MASDTSARADAILADLDLAADAPDLAERCLRKLANRHGHTKTRCPDPEAHVRDVAVMAVVLEAAGFVPYEPGGVRTVWGPKPRHRNTRSEGGDT